MKLNRGSRKKKKRDFKRNFNKAEHAIKRRKKKIGEKFLKLSILERKRCSEHASLSTNKTHTATKNLSEKWTR
jgi:hypothetical protein